MGYGIRVVNVAAPSLHIGGVMSVVGERQVLACDGVFPTGFFAGFDVITVPTADFIGGNVITSGEGRSSRNGATRRRSRRWRKPDSRYIHSICRSSSKAVGDRVA